MSNIEKVFDSRDSEIEVIGEGEVEILMVIRNPKGAKEIPLRIWTVNNTAEGSGVGVVLDANAASFVRSFWKAADEAVQEALANAPDECDCNKCKARRAIEKKVGNLGEVMGKDHPLAKMLEDAVAELGKKHKMH